MQCSCQRRNNPSTSTPSAGRSHQSRPYQQIVFESTATGNTRFEWISSTTTSTPPDETRRRVRSHVMQRFRAQQALGHQVPASNQVEVFADYDPRIKYYFICRTCGRLNTECCRETTSERDVESHLRGLSMRCENIYRNRQEVLLTYLVQRYLPTIHWKRRSSMNTVSISIHVRLSNVS